VKQKRIKIYSLATTYPESISSTKPKFVHLLNKELVKKGFSVKVIVPHSKNSKKIETIDSVLVKRFKYLPENIELYEKSIPDELSQSKFAKFKILLMILTFFGCGFFECLKEKPDIIHGQWAFPGGYIAYLLSKFFGTRCVVSIHGAETPLLKKYNFLKRITIKSLNKSSAVTVNSDFTKNNYINMGVHKEKIIKINPVPNFVKHVSDTLTLNDFEKKFTTGDSKLILYTGRLVERKGVEYLIKSLLHVKAKKIHLIIAGDGWLKNDLQKLVESLNLQKEITFFENPSQEELGKLRQISDLFVLPSIVDSMGETEGLGLVIVEAMESGLPVIATSVGGITDIVKNEVNGILINQKNPHEIASAIDRIITDTELAKRLIHNSKQTITDFEPEKIADKYSSLFKTILNI